MKKEIKQKVKKEVKKVLEQDSYESYVEGVMKENIEKSFAGQVLKTVIQEKIHTEKDNGIITVAVGKDEESFVHSKLKGNIPVMPEFTLRASGENETDAINILLSKEERILIKLLMYVAKNNKELNPAKPNKIIPILRDIDTSTLEGMQYQVEKHRIIADKFIFGDADELKPLQDKIDPTASAKELVLGYFGSIWGVNLLKSDLLFSGMLLSVTEGRYIGLRNIKSYGISTTRNKKGKAVHSEAYCTMSMCILNPRAVSLGVAEEYMNVLVNEKFDRILSA